VEGREAPGAYRSHEVHDPAEAAWPLVHTLPLTVSAYLLVPPKGARMRQRSNKSSSNKQQPTWPRIYQSQTSFLYSRRSQICLNLHQRLRGRSTVSCSHSLLGKRWTEPTMNPLRGNFKLSNSKDVGISTEDSGGGTRCRAITHRWRTYGRYQLSVPRGIWPERERT
jgi:hypothetical protein